MIDPHLQNSEHSAPALKNHAREIRRHLVEMHFKTQAGHLGTGLSSVDILTYLYGAWLQPADRFILSKGHGASALYATLHHFKHWSDSEIETYYRDGTLLPAHPAPGVWKEIPAATGSLGHGLSIAGGLAFASQVLDQDRSGARIACLLSDGECNEGSTWEAALFAGHHKLSRLTVVVDANGLQGFGRTQDVLNLEPFADKWRAFGFEVREADGHDFNSLADGLTGPGETESSGRPRCVIARTIKGKGLSFAEDRLEWHYLALKPELYEQAMKELEN